MSWVDIALGGGITLAGTGMAELLRGRAASSERSARQVEAANDFQRATLTTLRTAAMAYRIELTEYHRESANGTSVSDDRDRSLRAARMAYQAIEYEAAESVTTAMEAWERAALKWSQRDGGAGLENRLWLAAVKACGARAKDTHKIR